jgi:YidC/Oxa1 family membrane protein insertase
MKAQYRGIIAVVLSAVFFIVWFTYINPKKEQANVPAVTPEAGQQVAAAASPAPVQVKAEAVAATAAPDSKDPQAALPIRAAVIDNDFVHAEFTTDGGVPTTWLLKGYHQTTDTNSPLIDLAAIPSGLPEPLALSFADSNFSFPQKPRYSLISADATKVVFGWKSNEVEITKTIEFKKEHYVADVIVSIKSRSSKALYGRPTISWSGAFKPKKSTGLLGFVKQPPVDSDTPVYFMDGDVHREQKVQGLSESSTVSGQVYWAGLESRYFLSVVIPRVQAQGLSVSYGGVTPVAGGDRGLWTAVSLPKVHVPSGDTERATFSIYAGTKEINDLKAVGVQLDEAIDYGWFTVIAIPIVYLLQFFHSIIHNWGVAIILMTIFVKLLLHPINVKSLKSMKAMQQLQPRLKELQAKYKDDKPKLNQETMQLFKAHKVNPMGGCLPMLAQFPIYIALYKVLWNSIEIFHAPFFWFYKDLSAPDPYYIMPILLGIFMVAQQKIMPSTSADPAQKKMMMIMPVMFSGFMLFLPVGLVLYILVNTGMSVTQQWMYNKDIHMLDLIRGKWRPSKS